MPVPKECAGTAKVDILEFAESQNMELNEIPEHSSVTQLIPAGSPFFYLELPNKDRWDIRIHCEILY